MLSNEYIAGFFDGEGCINATSQTIKGKYEKFPRVQVQISITQNTIDVLHEIQSIYGGTISLKDKNLKGNTKPCYVLRIVGKYPMKKFLTAMFPFCVVKKHDIVLGLQFLETVRDENLGCVPLTKEIHELRNKIYVELRHRKS